MADIDRTPSLFLADLFSEEPNYFHPECGEFYTFGWCSEREMTFCLLLDLMGYENKIHQSGIHVNSQFWLDFSDNNGKQIPVVISVDNTFDIVSWYIPNRNKSDWLKDFGHGD